MMDIEKKLAIIKEKIELLIQQNTKLLAENDVLAQEIEQLKTKGELDKKLLNEIENKSLTSQFGSSLQSEEKKKLKIYIEDLIKEIDKGINLLKS